MNDKHINFALKYPETVINSDDSELMVKYMIENHIIPIIDKFKVDRCIYLYNIDNNVFN